MAARTEAVWRNRQGTWAAPSAGAQRTVGKSMPEGATCLWRRRRYPGSSDLPDARRRAVPPLGAGRRAPAAPTWGPLAFAASPGAVWRGAVPAGPRPRGVGFAAAVPAAAVPAAAPARPWPLARRP